MIQKKSFKILLYLASLLLVGTIGFYIIGGENWSLIDSLYMTIITLSTVGFGEVHALNEIGKIWAILIIIFGVSGFAIMVSQFGVELLKFQQYRRRKMISSISRMKNHYIICGYGRMGAVIAEELLEKKHPFVVIEQNEDKIATFEDLGYKYIQGDATLEETLLAARTKEAKGFVVVLDTDQDNLFVTMSVRTLNPDAFILSRYSKMDTRIKLKRAGADKVVNPYVAGGHKMTELLLSPKIADTASLSTPKHDLDFVIDEINLEEIDFYDGIMIKDSKLREDFNLMVIGIIEKSGEVQLNPDPHTILKNDQTVMFIGSKESMDKFKNRFFS